MPLFRPGLVLSRLLRSDPFHVPSAFPRSTLTFPLTRLLDDVVCKNNFSAPFYTIYQSTEQQQKGDQQKDGQSPPGQEVQDSRRDNWLERRQRRRGHHLRYHNNPFALFDAFSPFSSPFPSLFSPRHFLGPFGRAIGGGLPEMSVDMFSTPTSYNIHAAVPGLDKRDIKITVEEGILRIEAERREEKRERRPTTASLSSSSSSSSIPVNQPSTAAQAGKESSTGESSGPTVASTTSSESGAVKGGGEVDSAEEGVDYQHIESYYGRVERSLALPDDADADKLTARYENGVIKIEIPRVAEQKKEPRRIEIQ